MRNKAVNGFRKTVNEVLAGVGEVKAIRRVNADTIKVVLAKATAARLQIKRVLVGCIEDLLVILRYAAQIARILLAVQNDERFVLAHCEI